MFVGKVERRSLIYLSNKSRLKHQGCKNKLKSLNGFQEEYLRAKKLFATLCVFFFIY